MRWSLDRSCWRKRASVPLQISVVVPTYKRSELLERCLAALAQQDFAPGDYEIIVADDAACWETEQVAARWQRRSGAPLRYVPVLGPHHGPAAARNLGWRAARGQIIAFTDDDCIPESGWLRAGVAACEGVAGVSGRLVMPAPARPLTDYEHDALRLQTSEFVTANCFYRRDALEQAGGFDERFTQPWREDTDLFLTLSERGEKVGYAPDAVVIHPLRSAPWGISLRQQRRNLHNALLYKKHPRLYRQQIQPAPPWRYYGMVLSFGLATSWAWVGHTSLTLAALLCWGMLAALFCADRLRPTSKDLGHVLEMLLLRR